MKYNILLIAPLVLLSILCEAANNPDLTVTPMSGFSGDKYIGVWQDEVPNVHTLDVNTTAGKMKLTISWPEYYYNGNAASASRVTTALTISKNGGDGGIQLSKAANGPWSNTLTWGAEVDVTPASTDVDFYVKGITAGTAPLVASFTGSDSTPPYPQLSGTSDPFEVWVYKLDVLFDDISDANEELNGGLLAVDRNIDDVEKQSLKKCIIILAGPAGSGKTGHLIIDTDATLKAWKSQSPEPRADSAATVYSEAELRGGVTLWIEAKEPSASLRDGKIRMIFGDDVNHPITRDGVNITNVEIKAIAIKFDHKGPNGNVTDGLNIRRNRENDLEHLGNGVGDGEWLITGRHEPVLYVSDKQVTIKVKFKVYPACSGTAKILTKPDESTPSWLNVQETDVSMAGTNQETEYIEMKLEGNTPGEICQLWYNWKWRATALVVDGTSGSPCESGMNESGRHWGFVVLDVPHAPWYLSTETEPWSDVLAQLTQSGYGYNGLATLKGVMDNSTTRIYSNGNFEYDTEHGASFFIRGDGTFQLTRFLAHWTGGGETKLNCSDCARGVTSMSALFGCAPTDVQINDDFQLNIIDPIGLAAQQTNNCFSSPLIGDDARDGGFRMHRVSIMTGAIWDACLRVNLQSPADGILGSNPGAGTVQVPSGFVGELPRGSDARYVLRLVDAWTMSYDISATTPTFDNLGSDWDLE